MKLGQKMENPIPINNINVSHLYRRATEESVPFDKFNDWIVEEIQSIVNQRIACDQHFQHLEISDFGKSPFSVENYDSECSLLLTDLHHAVQAIIRHGKLFPDEVLTERNWIAIHLVVCIERCLMHKIKNGLRSLFGYVNTFWDFLCEGAILARWSPFLNDISKAKSAFKLKTPQGRGRSLIRLALRKNVLSEYLGSIRKCQRGKSFLASFYCSSVSVLGGYFTEFLSILHKLEDAKIPMIITPDDPKLDIAGFWKMTRGFPAQILQHSVFAPPRLDVPQSVESRALQRNSRSTRPLAAVSKFHSKNDLLSVDIGKELKKELAMLIQKVIRVNRGKLNMTLTEKNDHVNNICVFIRDCLSFGFVHNLQSSPRTTIAISGCRPLSAYTLWDLITDAAAILYEADDSEDVTEADRNDGLRSASIDDSVTPRLTSTSSLPCTTASSSESISTSHRAASDGSPLTTSVRPLTQLTRSFARTAKLSIVSNRVRSTAWVRDALNRREMPELMRALFRSKVLQSLINSRYVNQALVRRPEELDRLIATIQKLSAVNFNIRVDFDAEEEEQSEPEWSKYLENESESDVDFINSPRKSLHNVVKSLVRHVHNRTGISLQADSSIPTDPKHTPDDSSMHVTADSKRIKADSSIPTDSKHSHAYSRQLSGSANSRIDSNHSNANDYDSDDIKLFPPDFKSC